MFALVLTCVALYVCSKHVADWMGIALGIHVLIMTLNYESVKFLMPGKSLSYIMCLLFMIIVTIETW